MKPKSKDSAGKLYMCTGDVFSLENVIFAECSFWYFHAGGFRAGIEKKNKHYFACYGQKGDEKYTAWQNSSLHLAVVVFCKFIQGRTFLKISFKFIVISALYIFLLFRTTTRPIKIAIFCYEKFNLNANVNFYFI